MTSIRSPHAVTISRLDLSSPSAAPQGGQATEERTLDVFESPRPPRPVDSAARRRAHQAKNQTSARETISNLRETLNGLPEMVRRQARIVLDNNGLMKALIEDPSVLRGLGEGTPEAMAVVRGEMNNFVNRAALEGAYWTGMLAQAQEALGNLANTLETNDQARNGLLLAIEQDFPLGEVLADVRTGKLQEEMLVRFMNGEPKACDLASIFLYMRDKAGGEIFLDGKSPTFRAILDTLPIDERVNTDAIKQIHITNDNTIRVQLSKSEPLVASAFYDLGLGSELVLDVEANPVEGEGAFILSPRLPQGSGLKAVFFDLHLHLSGNGTFDHMIEVLLKIIFSPLLLVAALVVDSQDKRYVAKDEETLLRGPKAVAA